MPAWKWRTRCGIPDQDIEKIFDPFFSTKFTGRGLGLAVVLGIVRAHQGAVTVESKMGQGSVFRIFLPVSVEAIPQKPVHVAPTRNIAGGGLSACHAQAGTLLVAEDDPAVRQALAKMLQRLGFTVLAAVDGV
jgi:two-component system cell cycle sensor histidine kinase/response regulator CckA